MILLAAGEKRSADKRRFYKYLIEIADKRFDGHLAAVMDAAKPASRKERTHGKKP